MTRSGVDLASAFLSLSQQCSNPTMRNILAQVHKDVTGGRSISDAMQAQVAVFGDAYVASVAAGEAAGILPEVLDRLSQFQRTEMRMRAWIRTLLAYPLLLSSVSGMVVIGLSYSCCRSSSIFSASSKSLPRDYPGGRGNVRCPAQARVDLGAVDAGRVRRPDRFASRRVRATEVGLRDAQFTGAARDHAGVLHWPHVSLDGADDRERRAAARRSPSDAKQRAKHVVPKALRRFGRVDSQRPRACTR